MTSFRLKFPFVNDPVQQRNNDDLIGALNQVGQFLYWGDGAPLFTPDGRALYIRRDGGAGTTLYVYEGASWAAK